MKVIVLGTRGFPNIQGGVEKHCEHLYPALARRGCRIIVFSRKPYAGGKALVYKGVTLIPLSCPQNKHFEAIVHTLFGVLMARIMGCDILHVHAVGPSIIIPVARVLGFRVVMTNHGRDYERQKWGFIAKLILRLGERVGSRWSCAVIGISNSISDDIKARYERNVVTIPNGVVIPELGQPTDFLERHRLEKNRYILAVGRFVPEKGFHDLIDAYKDCSLDRWRLVIVGSADHPGRYSESLTRKAAENADIVLPGFLTGEPLRQLFCHAGLFVLPSYYEGLPIVLLEALSYGLSCIASDIPANRNLGLSSDRFFKAGSVKALSSKIREFINRSLAEDGKKRERDFLAQEFDWDNIADRTLAVYTRAAGRSR
jgi:glycosyltransferase involved in cell wall biosynthesis